MILLTLALVAAAILAVTLGCWLFRSRRPDVLLVASVLALYILQPGSLKPILPLATLLLVIGVWWIVNRDLTRQDWQTLLLIGIAALLPLLIVLPFDTGNALRILPVSAAVIGGTAALGSLVPAQDEAARR